MLSRYMRRRIARSRLRGRFTDRRRLITEGSAVKRNVGVHAGTLVATLLLRVSGARLVALVEVDGLSRLLVGAPAFLILQDCVFELALA